MNDPASSIGESSRNDLADRFFTEAIVGRPMGIALGRRYRKTPRSGMQYSPRLGTALEQWWKQDLESSAWRYRDATHIAVQAKPSSLRVFLERHSLRLALISIVLGLLVSVGFFLAAWQLGMAEALLSAWQLQ